MTPTDNSLTDFINQLLYTPDTEKNMKQEANYYYLYISLIRY